MIDMGGLAGAAGLAGSSQGGQKYVNDYSLLSPSQQKLLNQVTDYISGGLKTGATPSAYASYSPTPALLTQAFESGTKLFGYGQDTIIDAITKQAQGVPAYAFDAGKTSKLWNENFATPMMTSWTQNVMPVVKEAYNIPGMAGSSLMSRGVTDSANRYFSESVQPTLWSAYQQGMQNEFTSGENAASRQLAGATALGQLPTILNSGALTLGNAELSENERILAALRGEESRLMPENNPYLQQALGLSTSNTSENIVLNSRDHVKEWANGIGAVIMGIAALG